MSITEFIFSLPIRSNNDIRQPGDPLQQHALVRMGIEQETRLADDYIPFYHKTGKSVYFLYEVQTALVSLMNDWRNFGFNLAWTPDPLPIALRFLASTFSDIQRPEDITRGLQRHAEMVKICKELKSGPVVDASIANMPRFHDRMVGHCWYSKSRHQPLYQSVPRVPSFRDDHSRVYRQAAISANVAMVNNTEAHVTNIRRPYQIYGLDGVQAVKQLFEACKLCEGPSRSLPTSADCQRITERLWDVFNQFEQEEGVEFKSVLIQGFVHRNIARKVMKPTQSYGSLPPTHDGISYTDPVTTFNALRTITDGEFSKFAQWRIIPRVKYVNHEGIIANVIVYRPAPGDASAVPYTFLNRRRLLEAFQGVLMDYRDVWDFWLRRCVDTMANADLNIHPRWWHAENALYRRRRLDRLEAPIEEPRPAEDDDEDEEDLEGMTFTPPFRREDSIPPAATRPAAPVLVAEASESTTQGSGLSSLQSVGPIESPPPLPMRHAITYTDPLG